jgi:23S rRNA pseudouridine2605 synthase
MTNRTTPTVYLFHKPAGCICSARDPEGRRTIYDILPEKYRNLKYVGRLDYDTSGLLLMTDDGEFARKMTLPESKIPRVYVTKLGRTWTMDDEMIDRLLRPARKGMKIEGIIYRPMKIERMNATDFKITLTEGKKNEIRIVFGHIGLPVRKLHRISYGKYDLGDLPVKSIVQSQ